MIPWRDRSFSSFSWKLKFISQKSVGLVLCIFFIISVTQVKANPSQLIQKFKCGDCHRFTVPQSEKKYIGPDLFYAADKYQPTWIEKFLQKPQIIRKAGHTQDPGFLKGLPQFKGPHPAMSPENAKIMTQYLMSLKLKDLPPIEIDPAPLSKVGKVKAKMKFERDHSCIACHESVNLAGLPRGGVSGPSLLNAGNRLRASWVYHWLKDPRKFLNKGRMPIFKLDEDTLIQLTKYIVSHKKSDDE